MNSKIEILSPGGDVDAVKAAILAGADAVYLGLKKFNARKRAENITDEELKKLLNIAHSNNVKIFITMNILLTQNEIPEAIETAAELIGFGVDAIIVQDPGFAFLLKKYFPDLELHASTQMTTHNSLQIDFLNEFKFHQLNFARELSGKELKPLIKHSHKQKIKTEIFVHGAYCISCSGICYMSAAISAQPGNRGACLQPCRRRYGTDQNTEKDYLLSLKDNNALIHADDLIKAGADTLKIEGRIKNFNYVYQVTNAWRQEIDALEQHKELADKLQSNVRKVFNRDFSTGYYQSAISSDMFVNSPLDQSYKPIGKVESYFAKKNELTLNNNFHIEIGSRINIYTSENLFICGAIVKKKLNKKTYNIEIENQLKGKILKEQIVLLLNDQKESLSVKEKIDNLNPANEIINVKVSGKKSEKLKAVFSVNKKSIPVESESFLTKAEKNSLNIETLKKQFDRLGNTFFEIGRIDTDHLESGLFIPVKELNTMRRSAVDFFTPAKPKYEFVEPNRKNVSKEKKLSVLISNPNDINILPDSFEGKIFLETSTYTKAENFNNKIQPWLPSFILDNEISEYKKLISEINPELIVSDNSGLGNWLGKNNYNWIAGPQLNCTNGFSFQAYKTNANCAGAFYSTEINKEQINSISVPENFTTFFNVFGPVLLMTTRQCLFQKPNLCKQGKTITDQGCLNGCVNYTKYYDERNIPFHIVKSAGHQNRIFNDALLFLPEAINQTNADYYLLDFRTLNFNTRSKEDNIAIVNFFSDLVNTGASNKQNEKSVKELIGKITRGNYQRGFE